MYYFFPFLALLLVFSLGVWWNYAYGRRYRISIWITLWAIVPGFLTGRLAYFITHTCPRSTESFWDLSSGGNLAIGAFAGSIVGVLAYLKYRHVPVGEGMDLFAPYVPLGGFLGRIGCLCYGCCFGQPTSLPWAISFDGSSPAFIAQVNSNLLSPLAAFPLPVHPSQIYAMLAWLIIGAVLIRSRYWGLPAGGITFFLICLYLMKRILLDFFRGDHPRVLWNMNSTQIVAVFLLLICFGIFIFRVIRNG